METGGHLTNDAPEHVQRQVVELLRPLPTTPPNKRPAF